MESRLNLTRRVRERTLDCLDWIDFRPDPCCWPLLAVPLLLIGGALIVNLGAALVIFLASLALAITLAVGFLVVGTAWIIANALADVSLACIRQLGIAKKERIYRLSRRLARQT
jgi:hypothetical protein